MLNYGFNRDPTQRPHRAPSPYSGLAPVDPAWAEKTPRNLLLLSRENEFYTLVDEEMIKLSILAYTKEYEKCELKIETFL